MAYGLRYIVSFKNRIASDIYSCDIYEQDYVGASMTLAGADQPLTLAIDDQDLLAPIKATQLTLSFLTDPERPTDPTIENFYSDDDEKFRTDFYFVSTESGLGVRTLLFSGFIIQDDSSEPDSDKKHYITLRATDNLALLKSVPWDKTGTVPAFAKFPLKRYFDEFIEETGLPDTFLPWRRFTNIFENTTQDRTANPLAEGLMLSVLHSSMFQSAAAEAWDNGYDLLTKILTDLNASFLQASGRWVLYRPAEFSYFPNAIIPGVQTFSGTTTAVQTNPVVTISRQGGDVYPISEDLTKYIQRPLRQVLNTFNYRNPDSYIMQYDLSIPDDAVPYFTTTANGFRYDQYPINAAPDDHYFPDWRQTHNDTSYMVIVTEVATELEKERYIVTPGATSEQRGVELNPIEVTKGDVLDYTMQYRMDVVDTNGSFNVFVRFIVISNTGKSWHLIKSPGISDADPSALFWNEHLATEWDSNFGVYMRLDCADIDTMEWRQWSLSAMIDPERGRKMPPFPEDGMLLVEVRGTNGTDGFERQTTYWRDMDVLISNFLNDTTLITGHQHDQSGNPEIKAISANDLNLDDAPRSTIAGALFTNALTNFEYQDSAFNTFPEIGQVYFTRTVNWHRVARAESLKLGDIISRERLQMLYTSRYVREGTFRNVRYNLSGGGMAFIDALTVYEFEWLPGRFFFATKLTIDYMSNSFNARLQEIYKLNEADFIPEYLFRYLYKTE